MALTARRQSDRRRSVRGFTLTELMVSVAVLVIAMVAVGYIFSAVSKTSGLTTADIELTDAADVLRRTMQEDLNALAPGILVINSTNPESVSPHEHAYVPDASGEPSTNDANYAPRRDQLVFLTSTNPQTYASWAWGLTSGEAAVYYGHNGDPEWTNAYPLPIAPASQTPVPPAISRKLGRRAILLGVSDPGGLGFLAVYPLASNDVNFERFHRGGDDVVRERLPDLLLRLRSLNHDQIQGLWRRSAAYAAVSVDPGDPDYYANHAFQFVPRVGDFIVEWTDGSPSAAGGLKWYGQDRDVNADGEINIDEGDVTPYAQGWGSPVFGPEYPTDLPDYLQGYRVVWRVDRGTWSVRPKALRVTVRLYDASKRIRDEAQRLGQVRSFVLEVP